MRMIPKINHAQVKTVWKSTGEIEKDFTQNKDLQFRFCPFKIILGAINSTETGYKPPTSVPNDFNSFSKIFTGREAILAVWKNSFDLIEPNLTTGINATGKKVLKVGDVFYGNVISDQLGISYSASPSNSAFIQEQAIKNVVINIPNELKNFDFINNLLDNMYHLYMIPEINAVKTDTSYETDRQWYYLEVATKTYNNDTKEIAFIQATFSSLNDKLATSGLAINQYVQLGAVGEPIALPALDLNKNIILDSNYLTPRPVTHAQVTFYGTVGSIAIGLWGRNINKTDNKEINMNPTHLIFPLNYQASTYDPISFSALPETNYVLTVGAKSTVDTYQQWQETIAPMYDDNSKKTFEGHILTDVAKTTDTNKLDDTEKYTPYWDNKFLNNVALDTDKFFTLGNPYFVYFNQNTKKLRGQISGYIINNLKFKNLRNLNALMYFIYNSMNEIPLSVRETVKIQLNTIPVFGSFFNGFTGGMNIGFKKVSNLLIPRFDTVNFLMSAELYKFYTNVIYSSAKEKNIMPYDVFRNGTPDELPAMLGTSSHMTSFTFNLTDNINLSTYDIDNNNIVESKYMNLVNISQINPNNSEQIYLLPPVENFDLQPPIFSNDNYNGYYLDMIDILVQGKCNFKLTFYSMPNNYEGAVSDEFSIWAGTYQTVGKASGNIRLIKNNFVLANNTYSFKNKYNYPKAVNPPPPNEIPSTLFIDLTGQSLKNEFTSPHITDLSQRYKYFIYPNNNNYQSWTKNISIEIKDFNYENLNDFLNDYKQLQLSWNVNLSAIHADKHNNLNTSSPFIINDLKDIPQISGQYNPYFHENYANTYYPYADGGTEHQGNNCKFLVQISISPNLTKYYIKNLLDSTKYYTKLIGDTNNLGSKDDSRVTFIQAWLVMSFVGTTLNITINLIGSLHINTDYMTSTIISNINFQNIQISPRVT